MCMTLGVMRSNLSIKSSRVNIRDALEGNSSE